jgi:hypothetical protein
LQPHRPLETLPPRKNTAADKEPPDNEAINVIFDLPSAHQNFLWYHTAARFPLKETFIRAVCSGNYATWPKLTVQLIHKYIPDLDETAKEHLKGQSQGIRSTKQKDFEKMIKVEEARIKLKETPHLSAHSHQPYSTTYLCAWRT